MIIEILTTIMSITAYGSFMHLFDFVIRLMNNNKIRLFARYGTGIAAIFPAILIVTDKLLILAGFDEEQRKRILWLVSSAFFMACVPFGMGVIIAHVLEQILLDGNED